MLLHNIMDAHNSILSDFILNCDLFYFMLFMSSSS